MSGRPEGKRRSLAECLGVLRLYGMPVLAPRPVSGAVSDPVELDRYREQAVQYGIIADTPEAA